ncbi:hypothetical protein [Brevibacterium salitolerans]|uniref:hypothetical protein n=1 Tax=Brevibacterium salitolerans TaxID=1403566 RepID=UPI0031E31614
MATAYDLSIHLRTRAWAPLGSAPSFPIPDKFTFPGEDACGRSHDITSHVVLTSRHYRKRCWVVRVDIERRAIVKVWKETHVLQDVILQVQQFVDTLPAPLQVIALMVIAVVPIFEGDVAVAIGLVTGVWWPLALVTSAAGTGLATVVAVAAGAKLGSKRTKGEREQRVLARVEKWGIPIAMLLGGFFFSVTINAFVMSAAGLSRTLVLTSGIGTAIFNTLFVAALTSGFLALIF